MRHPFDGIIEPDQPEQPRDEAKSSRRQMLKLAGALGAGLAGARLVGAAPGVTTLAIGEEGGKPPKPPVRTTRALGEEGGRPSTKARGEEGGGKPSLGLNRVFTSRMKAFDEALAKGDVANASRQLRMMKMFQRYKAFQPKIEDARKRLGEKVAEVFKQAEADLAAKKHVEALKAFRAVAKVDGPVAIVDGCPQRAQATAQIAKMAKMPGYATTLREVQAQELYDTGCGASGSRKLAILKRVAQQYPNTPTGKKAAAEAKELAKKIPAVTTKAVGEEGGKKPPPTMTTMAIGEEGGKKPPIRTTGRLAEEGGKKPPPRATTMAIGEEG